MIFRHLIPWALLFIVGSASAAGYEPDIREFTAGSDLDFPGHPAFSLAEQATVEMWVAAGWQEDPGYDPVLLYHSDDSALLFAVSLLGDQSGLTMQAGERIDELPFSFADGRLHHVVLINLGDAIALMVDGQVVGRFDIQLATNPGVVFRLGSAPGPTASFTGAIGGLRIWDIAVEPEVLVRYALADVFDTAEPHPDLDSLMAYSDLNNNTIEITPQDGEI